MSDILLQLGLFSAKLFVVFIFIVLVLIALLAILAKGKEKTKQRLTVKNLNKKYSENKEIILEETLSKKQFKQYAKEKKSAEKAVENENKKCIYVLDFQGDIKASNVTSLTEEINTILNVAKAGDEVLLRLESAGGVVHGYGLAAAQLMRLRARGIPLIVSIDKIAASGGYMMACIANKILAAPFSIVGSIGVIVQLPNFHRMLKDKHIDFEQHTAGEFKRTITVFGENTEEGRKKLQAELEDMHHLFKNLITQHRPQLDIQRVATGEHWLGQQALNLQLVDEIKTGDDYLFEQSTDAHLYQISIETKKPFAARLLSGLRGDGHSAMSLTPQV